MSSIVLNTSSVLLAATTFAAPDIYRIESQFSSTQGEAPLTQQSLGFAVEADGFLLTAYEPLTHPVSGELSTEITLVVDETYDTQVVDIIGVEPTMGFAILKVDNENPLDLFNLHKARDFESGDPVEAKALNSDGELITVTGRFTQMNTLDCYQQSLTGTMFRARIDIPESGIGSPLLNEDGSVFAIHTGYQPIDEQHVDDDTGIHLLPISLAMTVYDGVKLRENIESPWTGFSVRHLNETERASFPYYNGRIKSGITIDHIWPDSPAEQIGLNSGDLLVKFGHYPIESVGDFQKWLYMYGVGHSLKLYVIRNDKLVTFDYTIEARPDWAQPQ